MSADDVTARLDALEQARERATPGRWMNDSHELYQEMPDVPGISGEWIGETCRIAGEPLYETSAADAALIVAAVNAVPDLIAAVRAALALAEEWRYKGEFGWGAWQEGHGPDPEGQVLDEAARELRAALRGGSDVR